MADLRFFKRAGPFSLSEIAKSVGGRLKDEADANLMIEDVIALASAGEGHLSFIDNRKYIGAFLTTSAAAVIAGEELAARAPATAAVLIAKDPYLAYAAAASLFYPPPAVTPGRSPHAVIDAGADVPDTSRIDAGAVISDGAKIGPGSVIGANAVIGPNVEVGADCHIGANTVLQYCVIGDRCILHPGVCIGQDGFGFALSAEGHRKVPQLGRVLIESDVEIGANSTVDRGAGPDTVIGAGTKIDNLVQVGHNVRIGRGCIIVSQAGVSGSTHVGDFVMIGGQAGLTGHLKIGDKSRIAGQSGVVKDVPPGATIGGSPARNMRDWLKESAVLAKLAKK
ncbi:MAG: UDP-3-O-(3-hydroxymyristoyl)glucosamine N-acyltransferase [Rhodospirillaceae bacterium]